MSCKERRKVTGIYKLPRSVKNDRKRQTGGDVNRNMAKLQLYIFQESKEK